MELEKEELARRLAKRAETAVKILKILVIIAGAVFAAAGIFCIIALTVISDRQTAVIGIIVFMCCIILLAVAVMSMLAYAYYALNKLKKLK
ncbi:MAG: hypothetical protein K2L12_03770 [Clostridia bacterium]|nr:hypothetical protein [Clostridia bacterium]